MNYMAESALRGTYVSAFDAGDEARAGFIFKTYVHLFGAVVAFVLLEAVFLVTPAMRALALAMVGHGGKAWLIVLGAFMFVSWIANAWASRSTSVGLQYAGLGLFVVAEAIIFMPLLLVAAAVGGLEIIPAAGLITLTVFTGLTLFAFITRKNFSFIGSALSIAGFAALAAIVCSILFGFSLGVFFTLAMIVFACGYILYDTSRILHEYQIGQHVAAALALFASVALLFWYILRLLLVLNRR